MEGKMIDDFHYYCVGVLARAAGFTASDALTIAYASQYVDDATENKPIAVGDYLFDPARTAHLGLGAGSWSIQKRVYIPFHFLPPKPFEEDGGNFIVKPDSPFSKLLIKRALSEKRERARLIALGVAVHTYADTWAHQGFSGRMHSENSVRRLEVMKDGEWRQFDPLTRLIRLGPRIGHVKAGVIPDLPFAKWKYVSPSTGVAVERDNPAIYMAAAKAIYELFLTVPKTSKSKPIPWSKISAPIGEIFREAQFGLKTRCEIWRETFEGMFKPLKFKYNKYRWRAKALGVKKSETHWDGKPAGVYFSSHRFEFREDFYESDWVLFHKAALKQRHLVLENLL